MLEAFKNPVAFGALIVVGALLAFHILQFIISMFGKEEVQEEVVKEEPKNDATTPA